MELYIHIPFCVKKCRYCDFYSAPGQRGVPRAYVDALLRELSRFAPDAPLRPDTLYFGGGTPLLLGEEHLCDIMASAAPLLSKRAEVTAEGNPAAGGKIDFGALKAAGINRISLGLQSSNERELAALGRIHSPKDAEDTVKAAQRAGIENISLDIFKVSQNSVP